MQIPNQKQLQKLRRWEAGLFYIKYFGGFTSHQSLLSVGGDAPARARSARIWRRFVQLD
jgi:hypothetical protein